MSVYIDKLLGGPLHYLQAQAADIGSLVFFKLISDYLDKQILLMSDGIMGRAMLWAGGVALALLTIWIMIVGYQIMTGSYRGSMSSLITDMGKKVVIVSAATSMVLFGNNLNVFFTHDLDRSVNYLITGEERTTSDAIDENLAYMQVALSAIDAVAVVDGNPEVREEKARALLFAGFGTSGPALTAGAMLIFFKFIIGFFIGLGPIFILMLMFNSTKSLFQRWLQYGIATLFAMAALNAVTSIVLGLSTRVAAAFWGARMINLIPGLSPEGLSSQAMQQGGIGLLLTAALITVPSAVAAFFGGLASSFSPYPTLGPAGQPGPQGQPPGAYARQHNNAYNNSGTTTPSPSISSHRVASPSSGKALDEIKQSTNQREN
ncbi:type IV secretion system protein [Pseudoxanthomonas dokdonensis]|uniref:Type VI secretion protein n=1 Tax=Pseudoxanthomonas dokdonensis TaxID=344882 RepID=A0A0R0CQ91_9GAMM|nr:type IV secretion system protein [Pseudoxanthomonas dokdonensis]KRG72073.1 hypothetical protein ABB29_01040 [Pseudoxanthomonas dokdonensis]